jgi:RIO kinase 1
MRDSADFDDFGVTRRGRKHGQFDDDELAYAKRARHLPRLEAEDANDATDGLPEGDRWSIWDQSTPSERGPEPHPKWVVTDLAAVDYELGVLKTGKEADVFLVRRGVPGTDRSCLLAAKRYRDATHRQFHRDAGYLEGRRVRESRVNRAVANRSDFGRRAIAGQWANAEFNALVQLYTAGVPVPYPVQILGTEILLEFIGDADGIGAPRLAETSPEPAELASLWSQLVEAMAVLANAGFAHGDLSPYNLLVHHGRLVMIDLPQVIDIVSHPAGRSFLDRDAKNVANWFARAGHPKADPEALARHLAEEARLALARDRGKLTPPEAIAGLHRGRGRSRAVGYSDRGATVAARARSGAQVLQELTGGLLGLADRFALPQVLERRLGSLASLAAAQVVQLAGSLLGAVALLEVVEGVHGLLGAVALPHVVDAARRLLGLVAFLEVVRLGQQAVEELAEPGLDVGHGYLLGVTIHGH